MFRFLKLKRNDTESFEQNGASGQMIISNNYYLEEGLTDQ